MIHFMLLVTCLGLGFWGCAGQKKAIESEPIQVDTSRPLPVNIIKDVEHYVVELGDTLWDIAAMKYGDAFQWPMIWHANRDIISNPDIIEVGQNLVIPRSPSLRDGARAEASAWPPYHRKHRHKR